MQIRYFVLPFLLFVLLGLLFFSIVSEDMQKEIDYYKKRDALRDQQTLELRFKLKQSNEFRDSVVRDNSRLNLANEDLLRKYTLKDEELKRIKGSYDKKNAAELQNEMTRRAQ